MPGYEIRIKESREFWLDDLQFHPTWLGEVVYVEADGSVTRTGINRSTLQNGDQNKRSVRGPLNIQLGRLRSHLERTGKRWELERQAEINAKNAAKKAEREARQRVKDAAPELLVAVEALLNAIKREKVHGMDATIAQAHAAVAKAKGS